ncbi:MAG: hypothetical protein Q9M50_09615 [Methylococcales bacterium]|nr:hypothetical protein [Methylococcales bacterium]
MSFLEILFTLSSLAMFITWGWFMMLGFRANKAWGLSIIFLSPIAPFMFASRFARKARRAIYYYMITLFAFILLTAYIHFSTINFYRNLLGKIGQESIVENQYETQTAEIEQVLPQEDQINSPDINKEILRKEPPTIEASPVIEERIILPAVKTEPRKKPKRRGYKPVQLNSIHQYLNKRIIITTAIKTHKGKLSSVTALTLLIKKRSSSGSVVMPIKKSKIIKIEVYL